MFFPALLIALIWQQTTASPGMQSAPAVAQQPKVDFPKDIPKWLAEGEHKDIPWKVHLEKPVLTYQQREVVKAVAKMSGSALQERSTHRSLMFIIRVADENGKWLPGGNFVTQEIEKPLRHSEVQMESEVLLRPGKYTIATIVY